MSISYVNCLVQQTIVSQDQIPDIPQRLEKSYKKYIQDILTFFKSMKTMHKSINKIFEKIDPEDGFDEEEYLKYQNTKLITIRQDQLFQRMKDLFESQQKYFKIYYQE